jgi:hypothetical protein
MSRLKNKLSSQTDVDEAIRQLKAFYDEGEAQLKLGRPYAAPGTASAKERLGKAKAIANPQSGYSPAEIRKLFSACRKTRFVLTRSHVIKLITVPKGPQRQEVQDKILAEQLSTVQLGLFLRTRFGNRRPKAGRARDMHNWQDAENLILRFADQWQRMHEALITKCELSRSLRRPDSFSRNMTLAVETGFEGVERALRDLQQAINQTSPRKKKPL